MKPRNVFAIGATFALTFSETAIAHSAMTATSVIVKMKAQNGSGEDGTATLRQNGSSLTVTISVKNGTITPQPAHIHTGHCSKIGGVVYPLSNVISGNSTTTLKNATIASLQTGGFAINIHKSADDLATYVSCGEIPKV